MNMKGLGGDSDIINSMNMFHKEGIRGDSDREMGGEILIMTVNLGVCQNPQSLLGGGRGLLIGAQTA